MPNYLDSEIVIATAGNVRLLILIGFPWSSPFCSTKPTAGDSLKFFIAHGNSRLAHSFCAVCSTEGDFDCVWRVARQAHGGKVHRCRLLRLLWRCCFNDLREVALPENYLPLLTVACLSAHAQFYSSPFMGQIFIFSLWCVIFYRICCLFWHNMDTSSWVLHVLPPFCVFYLNSVVHCLYW